MIQIMKNPPSKATSIVHISLLGLALFLLAWAAFSSLTFLTSDTGLRFLQIRELIAHQWQTFAIDYPAQFLDPDLQYPPYYYAYSLIDNQIYLNISHFLPWLASFLYVALGPIGLSVMPVLGGLLTAVAVYRLGVLAQVKYTRLLLWATVFGTPILFYSLELWDHTLAAACATWAVYGAASGIMNGRWQPLAWGGAAAGIGLGQRPEMYPFAIALGMALIIITWPQWRKWTAFMGGGLAGALPIWFLQYRWVGHPFGLALAANLFDYGRPEAYPAQSYSGVPMPPAAKVGYLLLHIRPQTIILVAVFLLIVGIFTLIFSLRLPALRRSHWLWGGLALTLLGYGMYFIHAKSNMLVGLVTTFPVMAFAIAHVDQSNDESATRPVYRLTWLTALLFLGIMLAFWPTFGGSQWGARYLLPVYPLLLFSAFYSYTAWSQGEERPYTNRLRIIFFALLSASFMLQAMGARLLLIKHSEQIAIRNAVAKLPTELILTNNLFFPSTMASLDDKLFMYVDSDEDWDIVIPRLIQHNIYQFTLIPTEAIPMRVPEQIGNIRLHRVSDLIYELEISDP